MLRASEQTTGKWNEHKPEIRHIMLLLFYIIRLCFGRCCICRDRACFIQSLNESFLIRFICWKIQKAFGSESGENKKHWNNKPNVKFLPVSPFKLVVICSSWMLLAAGETWLFKLGSCATVPLDFSVILLETNKQTHTFNMKTHWETDIEYGQTHKTAPFGRLSYIQC